MIRSRVQHLAILLIYAASLAGLVLSCSRSSNRRPATNAPPSASVTTPVGVVTGTAALSFDLTDQESNAVSIVAEFSIDSGGTWSAADTGASQTTGLASSPSGFSHVLTWNTVSDGVGLAGPVATVRFRISPSDTAPGTPGVTLDFTVDNTVPNNPPTAAVVTPTGVVTGTVAISFDIIDQESNPVDIVAEFSIDSGVNYAAADVGSSPTTSLASSPAGVAHTVDWNTVSDGVGLAGPIATVRFRISPSDPAPGTPGATLDFIVNNAAPNTPPSVSVVTPLGVNSGTVPISFSLTDQESNVIVIIVRFSTDSGVTYFGADVGSSPTTGLASSPAGVAHTVDWDTIANGVGFAGPIATVRFNITPSDTAPGTPGETLDFTVDNFIPGGPPMAIVTTPTCIASGTAMIIPTVLSDPDSDPVSIVPEFSTDSGNNWSVANLGPFSLTGIPTSPVGIAYDLPWDSVADGVGLTGPVTTVRFRVTPSDAALGTAGETADFTVDNTPRFLFVHHQQVGERNVSVFQIDACTGAITETPNSPFPLDSTGSPFGTWDLHFVSGRLIVPAWRTQAWISAYDVDALTGDLTLVPSSPVQTGGEYLRTIAMDGSRVFGVHMTTLDISVLDYDALTGGLAVTAGSPFPTLGRQPIRIAYGDNRVFCTNTLTDAVTGNPPGIAVLDVDAVSGDLTHAVGSPFPFAGPEFILYQGGRLIVTRKSSPAAIAVFDVDPGTGALTNVIGSPFFVTGNSAMEVAFDNDRIFVTHTDSNEVGVFDLDPVTGALTEVAGSPFATGGGPWGIAIQQGRLFVANRYDDTIGVFDIDPATGALTQVPGSPFPSGGMDTVVLEVTR